MNNEYDSEESAHFKCGECEILMEALRDAEQQCREAEDDRAFIAMGESVPKFAEPWDDECLYFNRLRKLERRRDCAFEVLLKHQRLEHL